jgi:hypothetical protein
LGLGHKGIGGIFELVALGMLHSIRNPGVKRDNLTLIHLEATMKKGCSKMIK